MTSKNTTPRHYHPAQIFGLTKDLSCFKLVGATAACRGKMAERTGLEPATPGVTGRYSNRLNYRSVVTQPQGARLERDWWVLQGSNLRPTACKAVALPTELNTRRSEGRYLSR